MEEEERLGGGGIREREREVCAGGEGSNLFYK